MAEAQNPIAGALSGLIESDQATREKLAAVSLIVGLLARDAKDQSRFDTLLSQWRGEAAKRDESTQGRAEKVAQYMEWVLGRRGPV